MNDKEFRAFLDLMMCSDPWPIPPDATGYDGWIEAYHRFEE